MPVLEELLGEAVTAGLFWGKKQEQEHPRDHDGKFRKGAPSLTSVRLHSDSQIHADPETGRKKDQWRFDPGDIFAGTKNGKERLRQGPGGSAYHEKHTDDAGWQVVERKKSFLDFVGDPESGFESTRNRLTANGKFLLAQRDERGAFPKAELDSTPSQMDDATKARFDAALTGDAAYAAPKLALQDLEWRGPEMEALRNYSQEGYTDMNAQLRTGGAGNPEIDRVLARSSLQHDAIVYRGVKDGAKVFGAAWDPSLGSMVGTEYRDPAYTSTSVSLATALHFAHDQQGVAIRMHAPAGTPAVSMLSVENRNHARSEQEILFPHGMGFRIVGDHLENGIRTLDVEVIQ